MMARRRIGRSTVAVTEIGLGGAPLGNLYRAIPDEEAEATLQRAWEAGIRYFDVAPLYGHGRAEVRLGRFLRSRPRAEFALSTKVGRVLEPAEDGQVPDFSYADPLPYRIRFDYTRDGILRSFEQSRQRLGLEHIDILFVHDIGVMTHGPEANARHMRDLLDSGVRALEELRASGAIGATGLGVNECAVCLELLGRMPIDAILLAGRYTLLDQEGAQALIPACREAGVSLVLGGIFNSGILATGAVSGARFNYAPAPPEILERVRRIEAVCRRHGVPLKAAALRFAEGHPQVASRLLGAARVAELEESLRLLEFPVPDALWAELESEGLARRERGEER